MNSVVSMCSNHFTNFRSLNCFESDYTRYCITPLKTKRIPLDLKTQSVPRCKHFISVIKTNQFML